MFIHQQYDISLVFSYIYFTFSFLSRTLATFFTCDANNEKIHAHYACNGFADCPDRQDEKNCGKACFQLKFNARRILLN